MRKINVTEEVEFELNDDESLPVKKCICGQKYNPWDFIISFDEDEPSKCPKCGREFYFNIKIEVFLIER